MAGGATRASLAPLRPLCGRLRPKTDDQVLDPLTIPSLRGAHLLAPYGHDGRTLSLLMTFRHV
jgi:hypothetical protein